MSIDTMIDKINKKYGPGTLVRARDAIGLRIRHFSTGSAALDIALGGGFPENRIIEIIGNFSAYKSTVSIKAGKSFLKKGPKRYVVYFDVERTFDVNWLKELGGDADRFLLVSPVTGEHAGDIACDIIKEGDPVLLIVDSVAALMPSKEMEEGKGGKMASQQPGSHARLMSKMFRKITALLKRDMLSNEPHCTVIFLNQIRMKIGLMFGNPETGTGGKASEFYASQQIILKREKFIAENMDADDDEIKRTLGTVIRFVVKKNKCGGPQNEHGSFSFYNVKHGKHAPADFDNATDILPYAFIQGFVKRTGRSGVSYRGKKFRSKDRFVEYMLDNPKILDRLIEEVKISACPRYKPRKVEKKGGKKLTWA